MRENPGCELPAAIAEMARAGNVAESVIAFVGWRDWVSFAELQRYFQPLCDVRSDWSMTLGANANHIVWVGLSEAFSGAAGSGECQAAVLPAGGSTDVCD